MEWLHTRRQSLCPTSCISGAPTAVHYVKDLSCMVFTRIHSSLTWTQKEKWSCQLLRSNKETVVVYSVLLSLFESIGLKLILNVQQDEYIDGVNEGAGARVVVHSQDRMPFPQDEGVLVTPGQLSSLGVRQVSCNDVTAQPWLDFPICRRGAYNSFACLALQVTLQRLPAPHGDCLETDKDNSDRNVFEQHYPETKYSATVSQMETTPFAFWRNCLFLVVSLRTVFEIYNCLVYNQCLNRGPLLLAGLLQNMLPEAADWDVRLRRSCLSTQRRCSGWHHWRLGLSWGRQ